MSARSACTATTDLSGASDPAGIADQEIERFFGAAEGLRLDPRRVEELACAGANYKRAGIIDVGEFDALGKMLGCIFQTLDELGKRIADHGLAVVEQDAGPLRFALQAFADGDQTGLGVRIGFNPANIVSQDPNLRHFNAFERILVHLRVQSQLH